MLFSKIVLCKNTIFEMYYIRLVKPQRLCLTLQVAKLGPVLVVGWREAKPCLPA